MASRRNTNWRLRAQRLICLIVLVGVACAFLPVPGSTKLEDGKDNSRPFPCQNRPCGCRTADQCWKQCCCFTNSQKVAWAKSQGVVPPGFVVAAADSEAAGASHVAKSHTGNGGCCGASCHGSPRVKIVAKKSAKGPRPSSDSQKSQKTVMVIAAQTCQGHNWHWVSLPWSVGVAVVCIERRAIPGNFWTVPDPRSCERGSEEPPVPPPR